MHDKTEGELIVGSGKDPERFRPLYEKYYPVILRFVYKRVEQLDDAKEITAIVFSNALLKISKYKDLGYPFSSWLYRIAVNEVNQFYRRSKKTRIISIDEAEILSIAEESHIEKENLSILKRSLLHLDPDELNLIELRFFEGLSFSEIGNILGITENNSKVKAYRVLDKLRVVFHKIS